MIKFSKTQILAALSLALTTVIWGGGFVVTKNAVESVSPAYMMAIRFTVAGAAIMVIFRKKTAKIKKEDAIPGALLGVWLAVSFITQTYGIKHTTASNNAFITTFYVAAVPFINLLIYKIKIRGVHLIAAAIALSGVALLSVDKNFRVNSGDLLTFACSLCYAVHIVLLGRYAKKRDATALAAVQMIAAAVFCWVSAFILEGAFDFGAFTGGSGGTLLGGILYLALLSTMFGFLSQTFAQKHLPTALVSVLLTLECVFGAVFSVIFLNDPINIKITAGFALMLAAVILSILKADAGG